MNLRQALAFGLTPVLLAASAPAVAGVQYIYDSSGRLIKAIYSNGITIEYRYDAAGNRTQIVTSNIPNSPPVAVNDTASVNASGSVDIQVRANDSDANGNTLAVTAVGAPTGGGSVSIQGGGTYVRYTAPATAGTKTFTYTISDGAGGTASATVTVTVSAVNQPPVAVDDYGSASISTSQALFVLSNDTDANGHALTVTGVSNVTGGSATIASGGGYVTFNAPGFIGTYSFNYTVSDGNGGTDVGLVTVDVTSGELCDPMSGQQCDLDP
ncbi:MAG: Ig-like domain-containing protein [Brevundimonas sp.]|uniref:Ig-like domain-containing protein n=1 Tax=Brevundimonas sp. TaxID=1871086 RepID=UPI00263A2D1D|nr:Ig-like domain-containing protein [Brevundimonas sp.]MDI6623497.1 Ig-like domain-containing protein [Brevundimonas sp.]MDQ7812064.1 Ig-like domain-containing protein [Brevundimonas sp.]